MRSPVLAPSRLRPFGQLAGPMVVLIIAGNFLLNLSSILFLDWLPRQFFGIDFLEDNRRRARGAAAEYRRETALSLEPLVVILGLSSASEGISLATLRESDGSRRYLGLSGAGRNIEEVVLYAQPLLDGDLPADLVVLAISSFHLIDRWPLLETTLGANLLANLRNAAWYEYLGIWTWQHRGDVRHAVDLRLLDLRTNLFRALDVELTEELQDPWREMVRMGLPDTGSEIQLRVKIDQYGRRGYYEAEAYLRSRDQIRALIDLMARLRSRGIRVEIVLMPEHSALRQRIPAVALAALVEPLRKAFPEEPPRILDFRTAASDTEFTDISHMNPSGRARFSRLLAEAIHDEPSGLAADSFQGLDSPR